MKCLKSSTLASTWLLQILAWAFATLFVAGQNRPDLVFEIGERLV